MIDTIVLMLQYPEHFSIADHDRFSPSSRGLFQSPYYTLGARGNFSCVQNPTAEELRNGNYKPRLTATRRVSRGGLPVFLRIEFSAPKLIFGNNFDEVEDSHFALVADTLLKKLRDMGVRITHDALVNAPVSAVHYSKNIPLTDYTLPSSILKELAKIDLTKALDLNQTDFRNEGHCLKFHANSHELALYDKMKDLQKAKTSEKRAVENDNAVQLELFDQLKPKKPFEVLRIEARLGKREVIRQRFEKAGIKVAPTFAGIFKKTIAQKILFSYFEIIETGYALLGYQPRTGKDFFAYFRTIRPKAKPKKILQMLGMLTICQEVGIRGFRELLEPCGKHHWPRLKKDWQGCSIKAPCPVLKPIQDALRTFTPLRLSNFCERNNWQSQGDAIKCNP
jgi:hypothetical protein